MKYFIVFMLIFIMSCSTHNNKDSEIKSPEIVKKQSTLKPFENVSIEELKIIVESRNIKKNQVNICGVVKKKFICPPCPEGAECEQCPPDYIVVSDGKSSITITCHPVYFLENEEYCFSLVRKEYTNGFPFYIAGWENN